METSDQINALTLTVLSRCRESLTTLILFLDGSPNANSSIAELGKQLHSCRDLLGGQAEIARRLGLGSDKNPVIRLDVLLRLLVKVQANATSTGMALDSVAIAGLRLLVHLEYLQSTQPRLSFNTSLPDLAKEQAHIRAYRQIRALELVLRGLIAEAHGNELEDKLISRYGREQIEKWRKASSSSDLLSGSLMRDLRNLLVDKKDYSDHYQSLFESQHHLRLLLTQRETLEQLLDEICNIRNTVAHNKDLSSAQTTLLDLCYSDIITPLQFACDEGRTQVNPDQFYDADQDSLQRWRDEVRDKLDMLGDDMVAISEGVKEINDTTKQIDSNVKNIQRQAQVIDENLRNVSADTSWLRAHWRKLALGMTVGLAAVVTISVANLGSSAKTLINTQDIKSGVQAIDSKMDTVKKEISSDPRKELANLGIQWNENNLREAIDRGDVDTAKLFMEGGMMWRPYVAIKSIKRNDAEIVKMLLNYPQLVAVSDKDCMLVMSEMVRREDLPPGSSSDVLTATVHKLTDIERRFLKEVCAKPADVRYAKTKLESQQSFWRKQKAEYDEALATAKKNVVPVAVCRRDLMANDALLVRMNPAAFYRPPSSSTANARLMNTFIDLGAGRRVPLADIEILIEPFCQEHAKPPEKPNIDIDDWDIKGWQQIVDSIS
jgi:hypothetical protein